MNYIKRLERDLLAQSQSMITLKQEIYAVYNYLLSPKFIKDPTVQVRDVMSRLDGAIQLADDVFFEVRDRREVDPCDPNP